MIKQETIVKYAENKLLKKVSKLIPEKYPLSAEEYKKWRKELIETLYKGKI